MMKNCHKCGWVFDDILDFCPECETENFSDFVSNIGTKKEQTFFGAWILISGRARNGKESNPPLYTRICTDDIKHKTSGKRYVRGRYVVFLTSRGETPPPLIEDTEDFRIIFNKSIFEKIINK